MAPRSAPTERTATLARAVVSRLAPEELPAFDLLAEPYLTGVDDSVDGNELQFGVMEAVATVTPVVTLICAGVVGALLRGAEGELEQLGGQATRGLFGALRRRPAVTVSPGRTEWTREQLTEIRTVAAGRAVALGVEPELAGAIADAVVGALLLDGPEAAE